MNFDRDGKWMPRRGIQEPFLNFYHELQDVLKGHISDTEARALEVAVPENELWHSMIHALTEMSNGLDDETGEEIIL